jgi:hypothetical protein
VHEQLAGHFRAALVDLGKMDASEDNGVDERRGKLESVACGAATCTARWTTWDGKSEVTRYEIHGGRRCFTAIATPRLPDVLDDTIGAYGAHPLNDLSTRPGLSC